MAFHRIVFSVSVNGFVLFIATYRPSQYNDSFIWRRHHALPTITRDLSFHGLVTFTPIVEGLAMELSIPVLKTCFP